MSQFVLKMAVREMRGSSRHFFYFLISIAIGVGSIVGVGNIAANFEAMTQHEARNLLAGDLEIFLNRPLSDKGKQLLNDLASEGFDIMHLSELVGMASNTTTGETLLVELKAVGSAYPFYGQLKTDPPLTNPFEKPDGVLVEEGILMRLKLKVGDPLNIGDATFTILSVIRREPDRVAGPFSLGPRILLSQEALERAELIQVGSRVKHRLLLKTSNNRPPEALKENLVERFSEENVRIRTYLEVRPRLTRFLKNFSTYLGLVGLVTLMIGGIGVAGNVHAFLRERIKTIATLKSLGCEAKSIYQLYLLLALILGGVGGGMGILVGMGIYFALQSFLVGLLPPEFTFHMTLLPMIQGMTMGLLTTFLVSLWPLRIVGEVSPARVFRQEVETNEGLTKSWMDVRRIALILIMIIGWMGLAVWQARSWRLGGWLSIYVLLATLLLFLVGKGILFLIKKTGAPRQLIFRYGLKNLHRPGRQVMTILLSLGIGVMILLTLVQVEQRLLGELQQNIPENAPGLFFIDIQPDQKEPLEKMLTEWKMDAPPELTPLIRSRLFEIDGQKVSEIDLEGRRDSWYFTREYVLTYQENLPKYNTLTAGAWWGNDAEGLLISAETESARHLDVTLGTEMVFDIQGVLVKGTVSSLRDVEWGSMTTNFYFIFNPATLSGAPETYVATVTAKAENDIPIQNAIIGAFPNVTVIPIREILETVARILTEITRTIRFMALLALVVGVVVVAGAISATRAERIHEMTLFKTLGATRPELMAMMAVEYAILGSISAVVGGGFSVAISWGIVDIILKLPWQIEWGVLLGGGIATVLLTLLTGFLTSYRVLGERPLAALRAE